MNEPSRKALFLDRDGVINIDHGFVHKPDDFDFVDGIAELCLAALAKGYCLIVVTNQSGIGRGYFSEAQYQQLTDWYKEKLAQQGVTITHVYHCPYHSEHGLGEYKQPSEDRKPSPGMLHRAARDYDIDLTMSLMIGDSERDIAAAKAAGLRLALLLTEQQADTAPETAADHVIASLSEAHPLL